MAGSRGTAARLAVAVSVLAASAAAVAAPTPVAPAGRKEILETVRRGQAALESRKPGEALELYGGALDAASARRDVLLAAAIYDLIGEVQEGRGRYQHALTMYERGLEALRSGQPGGGADIIAEAQRMLESRGKTVPEQTGPPIAADLNRGEIPDLARLLEGPRAADDLATALLVNAGNMYLEQQQFPQAELLYQQALQAGKGAPGAAARQRILSNLGWSAIKQRRFEDAERWLGQALEPAPSSPAAIASRRSYLALGVSFREQRQFEKAIPDLKRAVELYRQAANDEKGLVRAQAHLATAYLQAGRPVEAREQYLEALLRNESAGDVETRWHASGGLGRANQLLGRLADAMKAYEACLDALQETGNDLLTDQGKMSFLESQDQVFEYYVATALAVAAETGRDTVARDAIERVRDKALETLLTSRTRSKRARPGCLTAASVLPERHSAPPLSVEQWSPGVSLGPVANMMAPGVSLEPAPNAMARGVPLGPGGEAACTEPATVTLNAAPPPAPAAAPSATFLEYYVLSDRTAIVVKSGGRVFAASAPIGGAELETLVTEYLDSIGIEGRRGVSVGRQGVPVKTAVPRARPEPEIARQLHRLLVEPALARLPGSADETIVIVPHRSLWRLPFAALRDDSDRYFSNRFRLTFAASEPSWRLVAERPRSSDHRSARAWIAGNPQMPPSASACGLEFSLKPLPGAEREASDIARLFGPGRAELFRGPQADRLRLEAWQSDFSVLHLATHGVACPGEPLDSFVALASLDPASTSVDRVSEKMTLRADPRLPVWLPGYSRLAPARPDGQPAGITYPGLLDARTIINRFTLRADLVTLSACQTGLGRTLGQGTIGFTRAFLAAGARSLLVSLWNVDDDSTRDLMVAFYKEYLRHGNKALALQRAMQSVRRLHPEPRHWAPFTLVGLDE